MDEAAPHLDGAYAAFGKLTDGVETLKEISSTATDFRDRPLAPQIIKSVTVDTFGVEYGEPEKE